MHLYTTLTLEKWVLTFALHLVSMLLKFPFAQNIDSVEASSVDDE
jgi:hypothetical protein